MNILNKKIPKGVRSPNEIPSIINIIILCNSKINNYNANFNLN